MNHVKLVDFYQSADNVREDLEVSFPIKYTFAGFLVVECEAKFLVSGVNVLLEGLSCAVLHLNHDVHREVLLVLLKEAIEGFLRQIGVVVIGAVGFIVGV